MTLNEFQGNRTSQAYYKSGIMSLEYHMAVPRAHLVYAALLVFLTGTSARSLRTPRLSKLFAVLFNMSDSRLAAVDFIIQMRQNVVRDAVVSIWDLVANRGRFHRNLHAGVVSQAQTQYEG